MTGFWILFRIFGVVFTRVKRVAEEEFERYRNISGAAYG